jgi:dihydrofolate reductase
VVSTTLKDASAWHNSDLNRGDVVETVRRLKEQPGKNILLDGSSVLAPLLIENNLVDEFALHVYPLVLGGGKKLWPPGNRANLKLVEATSLPTGVVYLRYRHAA